MALFAVSLSFVSGERKAQLSVDSKGGIVRLVSGDFAADSVDSSAGIFKALEGLKDIYGYEKPSEEFIIDKVLDAAYGKVYKLKQIYRGYAVFGRGLNIAVGHNGQILSISGNYLKGIDVSLKPELSAEKAIDILSCKYKDAEIYSAGLEIYSLYNKSPCLVYHIITDVNNGSRIFISAAGGEIIDEIALGEGVTIPSDPYNTTQKDYYGNDVSVTIERTTYPDENGDHTYVLADALRNIYIFDNKNDSDFSGQLYANTTGVFDDRVAVTAFLNFVKSFDFYADPDNIGVPLRGVDGSVNNIHDDAESNDEISVSAYMHYSVNYQNAAYIAGFKEDNPKNAVFIFGDGISTGLYNPAVALDIVGHEYQHAVTEYSGGLIYQGASGAINEAVSDVFGALIEGHSLTDDNFWLIGEDADFSGPGATRSMKNPSAFGYPDHYSSRRSFFDSYDNGYVHYNSSILTHLQYKMYSAMPEHFSAQNIGRLWYAALPLLAPDSDFSDFRVMMRQAAVLLRWDQNVLNTIDNCFESSGIMGTAGEHTITFDQGTLTGTPPAAITAVYCDKFMIPACDLTGKDVIFSGWSETGNIDDAEMYYPGTAYKMPAYDMILKPVVHAAMWNGLTPSVLSGSGKEYDPYLVKSARDLATFAYYINGYRFIEVPWSDYVIYFRMTTDIDLLNIPWIPIGLYDTAGIFMFYDSIEFDGGGHVIKNLNVTSDKYDPGRHYQGLFGFARTVNIYNLGIESGVVDTYAWHAGSIAGQLRGGIISNCYSKINVTNRSSYLDSPYAGGIAGYCISNGASIMQCYNTGDINGVYAGGISGGYHWEGHTIFANCYNTGNITGVIAGGIIGKTNKFSAVNCINTGAVTVSSSLSGWDACAGGIIGRMDSQSINLQLAGCKNTGLIDNTYAGSGGALIGQMEPSILSDCIIIFEKNHYKNQEKSYIGNLAELPDNLKSVFRGTAPVCSGDEKFSGCFDFDNKEYFSDLSYFGAADGVSIFDVGAEWRINPGAMPTLKTIEWWIDNRAGSFAGGNGTAANPYQIATAGQLALMNYLITKSGLSGYAGANYKLIADIDLSGYAWSGIGTDKDYFSGTFDGGGHIISNMSARTYRQYLAQNDDALRISMPALFASIRSDRGGYTYLHDFSIININSLSLHGNYNIYGAAAAVAVTAYSNGTLKIENIAATGIVTGTGTAGGIIAYINNGGYEASLTIEGCSFDGISSARYSGGIVGASLEYGRLIIRTSVNTADVGSYFTGYFPQYTFAGGIIGASYGPKVEIENCINTGRFFNLQGSAGGIIGSTHDDVFYHRSPMNISITGCIQSGTAYLSETTFNLGEIFGYFSELGVSGSTVLLKNNRYLSNGLPIVSDTVFDWFTITLCGNTAYPDISGFDFSDIEFFFNKDFFDIPPILSNRLYYLLNGEYATHTVTFLNWDGTVLSAQEILHRTDAVAPAGFGKAADAQYTYVFSGWDKDTGCVMEDIIAKAVYIEQINRYTYAFYHDDGVTVLKSETADYGALITPPPVPSKQSTAQYDYTFAGWDKGFDYVTGNIIIKAQFNALLRSYKVTFISGEEIVNSYISDYGSEIVFPADPEKEGYIFKGWYSDIKLRKKVGTAAVNDDLILYAKWTKILTGGEIAGIIIGSVAAAGICGFAIYWIVSKKKVFSGLRRH